MSDESCQMIKTAKEYWFWKEIHVDRIMCIWNLTTLKLLATKNCEKIVSPLFSTSNGQDKWILMLYPRGMNESLSNFISLWASPETSITRSTLKKISVSIVTCSKTLVRNSSTQISDNGAILINFRQSSVFSTDCSEITIEVHCHFNSLTVENPTFSFGSDMGQLSKNLRVLLEDPKFSDVTIIVGEDKLPAHKCLLSSRSSVFAAMFNCEELEECRKKEVKIVDFDSAVVKGMLEYIYTGQVTNIDVLADGVLGIAEKYDLQELKAQCEETLLNNIGIDNAAQILVLAKFYRASYLQKWVTQFIKHNICDVIKTDGYKEMNDPELLKDIIALAILPKSIAF